MTLAQRFARFAANLELDTIPAPALDKARACVLNGYGIALGSHPTPFFGVAERAVLAMDGEREDCWAAAAAARWPARRWPMRRCSMAVRRKTPAAWRTSAPSCCPC